MKDITSQKTDLIPNHPVYIFVHIGTGDYTA